MIFAGEKAEVFVQLVEVSNEAVMKIVSTLHCFRFNDSIQGTYTILYILRTFLCLRLCFFFLLIRYLQ